MKGAPTLSLSVALFCDVCGRSVEPVVCSDLAPRGAIKAAKVAPGWIRHQFSRNADRQDVCPQCAADVARFKAHAAAARQSAAKGVVR